MDYDRILQELSISDANIITTKAAKEAGISRAMLFKLCMGGSLQRIAKGQYILADQMPDELLSVRLRTVYLTFSYETALFCTASQAARPLSTASPLPPIRSLTCAPGGVQGLLHQYQVEIRRDNGRVMQMEKACQREHTSSGIWARF